MTEACLGLGANLGNREGRLAEALTRLEATDGIHVAAVSHVYATAPWGVTLQPDFLNICIRIETALAPFDLLRICKYIERAMGRKARAQWGPREIDVDVLLVEGAVPGGPNSVVVIRKAVAAKPIRVVQAEPAKKKGKK